MLEASAIRAYEKCMLGFLIEFMRRAIMLICCDNDEQDLAVVDRRLIYTHCLLARLVCDVERRQ